MKISIIYYSEHGHTKHIAEIIEKTIAENNDIEVASFMIDEINFEFLEKSNAIIFGSPVYNGNICWPLKAWFDESFEYNFEGKLGAAFAAADYIQGGGETCILSLINLMLVKGMLVYSGGSAFGKPFVNLGPVSYKENINESEEFFKIFARRFALKTRQLFKNC